jgi:hypothetical protein
LKKGRLTFIQANFLSHGRERIKVMKLINCSKRKNRGKNRETLLQNKMAPSEEVYNYSGV